MMIEVKLLIALNQSRFGPKENNDYKIVEPQKNEKTQRLNQSSDLLARLFYKR